MDAHRKIAVHEKIGGTTDADKQKYYVDRAFDIQNGIVTYKSSTTRTSEALIWTYRTTSCDVISIITTTVPVKDGYMKDINLENRTIRRLKPPSTKKAKALSGIQGGSPFEFGLSVDRVAAHKKIHKMLVSEKNDFMAKLNVSRFIRSKVENDAAVKIQARYRGHTVRLNYHDISENAHVNRNIRSNLKSYLANNFNMIVSYSKFRKRRGKVRHRSAIIIQCAFLRYLSRLCLSRRRQERYMQKRRTAATIIQKCLRGMVARARVRLIGERAHMILVLKSAVKIQTAVRGMFGRRRISMRRIKLKMVASAMIIHWYKSQFSRKMAAQFKAVLVSNRRKKGAMAMQQLVRRFLALRRVNRIRLRRLYKTIFKYVTAIQCCIRKFLAVARVRAVRVEVTKRRQREEDNARLKALVEKEEADHKEMEELLASADIFAQAKKQNNREVEDIYTGLVSTEDHTPQDVNADGDTLLTMAAATGNLELVRKCLKWEFNIHHRNTAGQSALVLAVTNNHMDVVKYIVAHVDTMERVVVEVDQANGTIVSRPSTAANQDTNAERSASAKNVASGGDSVSALGDGESVIKMDGGDSTVEGGGEGSLVIDGGDGAASAGSQSAALRPSIFSQDECCNLLSAACSIGVKEKDTTMLSTLLALGLDVNARSRSSGRTAIHAACSAGHLEAFKLLVKSKANLDAEDDSGQRCLHKAAKVSKQICELLLGLDPNFSSVYMSDLMRSMNIMKTDGDGKDSILIATLGGQSETIELLESTLKSAQTSGSKKSKKVQNSSVEEGEIGWTPADVADAMKLVESGNLLCMKRLMELGFDPNWKEEDTGATMASRACALGATDAIDLLMTVNADFTVVDNNGSTPLHCAAACVDTPSTLAHVLTHASAAKCGVVATTALCAVNADGNNVFHIAALHGVDLNIDLLARGAVEAGAMEAFNKEGLTPLMICCRRFEHKLITKYISMGAVPKMEDANGRCALWHMFHPDPLVMGSRRPVCSEWYAQICNSAVSSSSGGSDRKKDLQLVEDIKLVTSLIRKGCKIYKKSHIANPAHMLAINYRPSEPPVLSLPKSVDGSNITEKTDDSGSGSGIIDEVGDVLVAEGCVTLLKGLIGSLSPVECWKLFVSAIRFDEGNSKVLMNLLRNDIISQLMDSNEEHTDCIVNENAEHLFDSIDDMFTDDGNSPRANSPRLNNNNNNSNKLVKKKSLTSSQMNMSVGETFQVTKLQQVHFMGVSVVGWCVLLNNKNALSMFIRKGFDVTTHADVAGNPLLHFIALKGEDAEMINIVMTDRRCRVEQTNAKGQTAAVVAAKSCNFKVAQRLFTYRADPRVGLAGSYWAWVLAVARKREKNELNLQTGRVGDDDDTYFNISPDPFYLSWM